MQKVPAHMRETISENIRELRIRMFPGHGGSKKCAVAFGVSQQQWSPWERGSRTPDGIRLEEMAEFFKVPVAYFYEKHAFSDVPQENIPEPQSDSPYAPAIDVPADILLLTPSNANKQNPGSPPPPPSEDVSCPHCRAPVPGQPSGGGLRSKCGIMNSLADSLHGITITIHLRESDAVNFIIKEWMSNMNSSK